MALSAFIFTCCCFCFSSVSGRLGSLRRHNGVGALAYGSEVAEDVLRPTFDYNHSLDFVLVVPKYKLLFCYIPKNACSQFNGLVNALNGLVAPEDSPWFASSALGYFGWSREKLLKTLQSDEWYKATILRDPLERTLSAYLSKCVPGDDGNVEDGGQHCLGLRDEVTDGQLPSFPQFLEKLHRMGQAPGGLTDAHFRPQSDFCGGLNISEYNFVGTLDGNLNRQAKALLTSIGASGDLAVADKFFPRDGQRRTTDQNSLTRAAAPRIFKKYYNTAEILVQTYRTYHRDFISLPILQQRHVPSKICITCLFSLDFERRRALDWIAYHDLMGVDCFLLFLDRNRTNVNDVVGADVYQKLLDSPQVTLLDVEREGDRIPSAATMQDLSTIFGIRYLMTLDGDEFAVLEEGASDSARAITVAEAGDNVLSASASGSGSADIHASSLQERLEEATLSLTGGDVSEIEGSISATSETVAVASLDRPQSLRSFLDEVVGRQRALGVYMHRWDYGTNGFVQPPPLSDEPEFALLSERRGHADRAKPVARGGKVILNLPTGVEFVGVHTWTVPQAGGLMLLPNGTAFQCTPDCMCGDFCKDANHRRLHATNGEDASCDEKCLPANPQRLFVNHYKTGSLQECYARRAKSVWGQRTDDECNMMHPGTPQYLEADAASGFVKDPVLARYASAVRMRREELFPPVFAV